MSNRLRRPRVKFAFSVVLMVVLALHSVVYVTATAEIEASIPNFVSHAADEGWRVDAGVPRRAGWPWAPVVRLTHVVVTRTRTPTSPLWTAEQIDLATPFHDLTALHVRPTGAQLVQIPSYPPIELRAAEARLRIPFSAGRPATLFIQNLVVGAPKLVVRVDTIRGETRAPAGEAPGFGVTASGVQLVPPLPIPFAGPMTVSMQVVADTAACSPPVDPAPDARAGVEITAFETIWGPLHVTAAGTAGLDERRQPSGRATLRAKGAAEVVDALANGGLIASGQASAARAVLGLLMLGARGEPITLPIALADRTLSVARIPLLRLPAIDWPLP